ncbi:MAG: hypothetical protein JSW68_05030 [Burkholderiales bacterium]|nr:MAG: hypothetical protein JSW68_05030 [Burkholderiales bacterium]
MRHRPSPRPRNRRRRSRSAAGTARRPSGRRRFAAGCRLGGLRAAAGRKVRPADNFRQPVPRGLVHGQLAGCQAQSRRRHQRDQGQSPFEHPRPVAGQVRIQPAVPEHVEHNIGDQAPIAPSERWPGPEVCAQRGVGRSLVGQHAAQGLFEPAQQARRDHR